MSIIVNFTNRNIDALDSIRIYRTESRSEPATLIATIANDKVSYEDKTASYNRLYYYQTGAVFNGVENRSALFPAMSFRNNDSGPGPQTFLRGNHEFGLFGQVDYALLPSYGAIASISGVARNNATDPTVVLKWCVNGKIIYTFNIPYHSAISKDNLKTLFVPPNKESQVFTISLGQYTYKVRPPFATTLRGAIVGTGETYPLAYTDDVKLSEVAACLRVYQAPVVPNIGEQFWDFATNPGGGMWTNSYYDLTTYYMFYNDGSTLPYRATSGNAQFAPIYELDLS